MLAATLPSTGPEPVPPATVAPARPTNIWNVNPWVDALLYHFGWAWIVPPLLCVYTNQEKFLPLYLLVMVVNFVHLHFGLPYAYLDAEVRETHGRKLTIVPGLCVLAMAGMAFLPNQWMFGFQTLAFFAVLWNIWHVYMQKFGILRVYNAKSGVPAERQVPHWVDRMFIFGWIPLYFVYMGPHNAYLVASNATSLGPWVPRLLNVLTALEPYLLVPAIAFLVFTILNFLRYEYRATGLRNAARLSAALGMTALGSMFIIINPVLAYIAFGFGHAIEYVVFVIHFQGKRYSLPQYRETTMAWLTAHPWRLYGPFMLAVALVYVTCGILLPKTMFVGYHLSQWLFFWVVYESLIHFYTDGFLWKLRRPVVRQSI
jgi:hypothetical protein